MDITQVLIVVVSTAGTILGSKAVWNFWENRAKEKAKIFIENRRDENMYRDDLRERVAVLESKLERAEKEKNDLQQEILKMVEKIAMLSVEVEVLRRENKDLRSKISNDVHESKS